MDEQIHQEVAKAKKLLLAEHKKWLTSEGRDGFRINFSQSDLSGADFSNSELIGTRFHGSNVVGANFSNIDFRGCFLTDSLIDVGNLGEMLLVDSSGQKSHLSALKKQKAESGRSARRERRSANI